MRSLPVLLVGILASCTCGERQPERARPDAGSPRYRAPPNTRQVMQEFQRLVEEIRRRVGQRSMTAPARRLAELTINLPDAVKVDREAVKQQALALATTKQPTADFNALVDACQRCHATNSRPAHELVAKYRLGSGPQPVAAPRKK